LKPEVDEAKVCDEPVWPFKEVMAAVIIPNVDVLTHCVVEPFD
jgi:hypothetical protein